MDNLLFLVSNIFFLTYWITRKHPIVKFLATAILAGYVYSIKNYYLALQYYLFSIGDLFIEILPLNNSLILFSAGKLVKLFYFESYLSIVLCLVISYFSYWKTEKMIYSYIAIHLVHLYWIWQLGNQWFIVSNLMFILSDILIGINLLEYHLPYYEYVSYPLYWVSNLFSILASLD